MDSEDILFILYTSGSTGKPKVSPLATTAVSLVVNQTSGLPTTCDGL
jgi:acyl-coenzyme A synthetase/AMP-(fatty) acid ligase